MTSPPRVAQNGFRLPPVVTGTSLPQGRAPSPVLAASSSACLLSSHASSGPSSLQFFAFAFSFSIFLVTQRSMLGPISRSEVEPVPPALEAQSLNHWTTGEVPVFCFLRLNIYQAQGHYLLE